MKNEKKEESQSQDQINTPKKGNKKKNREKREESQSLEQLKTPVEEKKEKLKSPQTTEPNNDQHIEEKK